MEWNDHAIVLGLHRYGERCNVLHAFTKNHGHHKGVVKKCSSKKHSNLRLVTGAVVRLVWKAKRCLQLGEYVITEYAGKQYCAFTATSSNINVVQTLVAHLSLFPDRDPYPKLFNRTCQILQGLEHKNIMAVLRDFVNFELLVLAELGFGLDLKHCVLTGETDNLAFVSPKTGKAVTHSSGLQYANKLISLPNFLRPNAMEEYEPSSKELNMGLYLSGYFLNRYIWKPRNIQPPFSRSKLILD